MSYSVPFRCRDYADYKRAVEVMELLNRINNDYPITCVLGSGPKDPTEEGARHIDVQCASQAKIQHFMELGAELDKDIISLERNLKLDMDASTGPVATVDKPNGYRIPVGYPGSPMDMFDILSRLEEKLRKAREQSTDSDGQV